MKRRFLTPPKRKQHTLGSRQDSFVPQPLFFFLLSLGAEVPPYKGGIRSTARRLFHVAIFLSLIDPFPFSPYGSDRGQAALFFFSSTGRGANPPRVSV